MGGKSGQTIGYKYYMSLHMGIGRGPHNEIVDITVGGLSAWKAFGNDPICIKDSGQCIYINAPDLFGGDQKEGGIQGPAYVFNGARDQTLDMAVCSGLPSIAASLGGDVPAFRGVTTIWYDGEVCSMNPYPKEWAFRIRRTNAGWFDNVAWYPEKATIVMDGTDGEQVYGMNPAHILMEVNTNPEWGRGMPLSLIDENSFIYAANQLCAEGFGLCLPWFRRESIKEFIPIVINHVGGAMYIDRETGLLTFRLIRKDYVAADLPTFGPDSGLLRIEEDDSSADETAFNEITVTGFDPVRKEDLSLSFHNLASIQSVEEIISNAMEFKGIATRQLLARVGTRELKAQSTSQRRFTLYLDRRAWRIKPAMPFKINWPAKSIASMIVRAAEISDDKGEIKIKVVQDIFGLPDTVYIDPQPPIWEPPNRTPEPVDEAVLFEANYRDMFLRNTSPSVDQNESTIAVVAAPPVGVSTYQYDLATAIHGVETFVAHGTFGYTARAYLDGAITPLQTSITLDPTLLANFLLEYEDGMVVMIGNEQIGFTTLDEETGVAVVERGVADTIPQNHLDGATVWLVDDDVATDGRVYTPGEQVDAYALTRTSTAVLDMIDADVLSIIVNQRAFRPYPPGDVQVSGNSIYGVTYVTPEPVITWAHRDRLLQADQIVGHTEGDVGPEPGTQYRIRILDITGGDINSEGAPVAGEYFVDGTTWTYTTAMQVDDGVDGFESVGIEIVSIRDDTSGVLDIQFGMVSYFRYRFPVFLDADLLEIDGDIVLIDGEGISYD